MTTEAQHQALLTKDIYFPPTSKVGFQETHISRLYLTDQFVYKLKKPVNFGFLDFTTLEQRHHFCHEEIRLNARCCPDTYQDVVAIHEQAGIYSLNGAGKIVDYAVKMNRLPAQRMLDRLIEENDPTLAQEMERLGKCLANFHRTAGIIQHSHPSYRHIMCSNWQENFRQTAIYVGTTLPEGGIKHLRSWLTDFYRHHHQLLNQREQRGFIRDGHGDLHAEHICLTDPIKIFDCIEFNERFRHIDLIDELAFLTMDLEYRQRPDLAKRILLAYQTELEIGLTKELLRFYRVYRAWVRGKVESFLAADEQAATDTREHARQHAQRYFNLALGDICPPSLILISGLMGVGKSTLAHSLSRALRARLLRSDLVRKDLASDLQSSSQASFGQGIYTEQFDRLTYRKLQELANSTLTAGQPLIIDASFLHRNERDNFRELAARHNVPCHLLYLHCSPELCLQRLNQRQTAGTDISDGRAELYQQQKDLFETIDKKEDALEFETSEEVEKISGRVLCQLLTRRSLLLDNSII